MADDNLSLQQDLEVLQAFIAKTSYHVHGGVRRESRDAESSSRYESKSNETDFSEVELWRSRCESLNFILSRFVPFEQSAAVVEDASSTIYERLLSTADVDHNADAAPDDSFDPSKFRSMPQFKRVIQFDARAKLHSNANDRGDFHSSAQVSVESVETEIQSYRKLLASYEDELNAAWSREADLHKKLQFAGFSFGQDCLNCLNHLVSQVQAPALLNLSLSPSFSNHASLKKLIDQASKVLIETKIPPSDSFLNDIFNLQAHEVFLLLSRQIAAYRDSSLEMTRLSQHNILQDQVSC